MPDDLEQLIKELEAVTARMLASTCWERSGEFGELSAARYALATRLVDRRDLDASAAERIRVVIQGGCGLLAQVMAMRGEVLSAISETERQGRFASRLGGTVQCQAGSHRLVVNA